MMRAGLTAIVTVGGGALFTVRIEEALALPPPPVQRKPKVIVPVVAGVTVRVPLTLCVPLHAPLAVQAVALVDDQVREALAPTVIVVGLTDKVTVGAELTAAVTTTVAEAFALPPVPATARCSPC